jgi:hypothetical protein
MLSRSARQGLSRLMLRWPARREVLVSRAAADDDFASLCEIYAEAHHALETWRRSDHSLADARVAEYQDLAAEIEGEILDKIASHSDQSRP